MFAWMAPVRNKKYHVSQFRWIVVKQFFFLFMSVHYDPLRSNWVTFVTSGTSQYTVPAQFSQRVDVKQVWLFSKQASPAYNNSCVVMICAFA